MAPPNYDYNTEGTAGFDDGNMIVVTQAATCVLAKITVNPANSLLVRTGGGLQGLCGPCPRHEPGVAQLG